MRIYFMSICGTGMGNAALLMRELGHEVSGCDQATYPPMSTRLEESGVEIFEGFDAERLANLKPDLVVVGNVNTRGNEEIEWLLENPSQPKTSLPAFLGEQLLTTRSPLVVAGTHGKTTTTTMAAHVLREWKQEPGYFIGGVPNGFASGVAAGRPEGPFVIEGDEYDSAFFDKRSKFIHYRPRGLILNNLEMDHADIFRDLEDISRTFSHLVKLVPASGFILYNGEDENLRRILPVAWAASFRVGTSEANDLRIMGFSEDESGCHFTLQWKGENWGRINLPLWGLFNARNAAMAVLGAALISDEKPVLEWNPSVLNSFRGVRHRQEWIGEPNEAVVLHDFAHHPTAVASTLEALRHRYPGRTIVACLEARSNTSCRRVHFEAYVNALQKADRVFFGEVFRRERYPLEDRMDFFEMAHRLGPTTRAFGANQELLEFLRHSPEEWNGSVLVFFSNGSFDRLPEKLMISE